MGLKFKDPWTPEFLERLIRPLVEAERLVWCGVRVSGNRRQALFQVTVDREDGFITIDDCTVLSRLLQDILDLETGVPENYQLIVSSPGIDSPLSLEWQFRKNQGRFIQCPEVGGGLEGKIISVSPSGVVQLEVRGKSVTKTVSELEGARVTVMMPERKNPNRKRNETRNR